MGQPDPRGKQRQRQQRQHDREPVQQLDRVARLGQAGRGDQHERPADLVGGDLVEDANARLLEPGLDVVGQHA
jgi:C4-dicarboxylate-specific signal transduction histidine kinase